MRGFSKTRTKQDGFTIVELMVATAVFSVVILVCSLAIIHVGRMYYKGMIVNRTQDAARLIADDLTRAIQFGSTSSEVTFRKGEDFALHGGTPQVRVKTLCLGAVRYTFAESSRAQQSNTYTAEKVPYALWRDAPGSTVSCSALSIWDPTGNPGGTDGKSMLGENMRVTELDAEDHDGDGVWNIKVAVSYGDSDDLFEVDEHGHANYNVCKGVNASGQFCAVSQIETTVIKRLL